MTAMSDDELRWDLQASKEVIERELGTTCDILCYPYNKCDDRVMKIARQEGYRAAFAGSLQRNSTFSLRRIGSDYLTTPLAFATALRGNMQHFLALRGLLERSLV